MSKDRILASEIDGSSAKTSLLGLGAAEARERAKAAFDRRLERAKETLPERIIRMIDGCPAKYRGQYLRALMGELSPRQAIKAHCAQCVGWEDVLTRVGQCTSYGCPLHLLRPHQDKAAGECLS